MGNLLTQHPGADEGSPAGVSPPPPCTQAGTAMLPPRARWVLQPPNLQNGHPAPLMGVESCLDPKRLLSVSRTFLFSKAKIQNISDAISNPQE